MMPYAFIKQKTKMKKVTYKTLEKPKLSPL